MLKIKEKYRSNNKEDVTNVKETPGNKIKNKIIVEKTNNTRISTNLLP